MALQTNSYLTFKREAERLTNLVVLLSHAVPVLTRTINSPSTAAKVPLKPADNFPNDRTTGAVLVQWAADYDRDLACLIVISVLGYFEAYVRAALLEVYDLQGAAAAFVSLAQRRATRHWQSSSAAVAQARGALQARDDKRRADRFRKFSKVIDQAGFAFPPHLLSAYGASLLARKLSNDGRQSLRAWEIMGLLDDALLFKSSELQRSTFEPVRKLRNQIAHGAAPSLSVHEAVKMTAALRKLREELTLTSGDTSWCSRNTRPETVEGSDARSQLWKGPRT